MFAKNVVSTGRSIIGNRYLASKSSLNIAGIFPPIATPFGSDDRLALDQLDKNLQKWNSIDFRGYVVLGSNGEFPYLTLNEKLQLVERVKAKAADGRLVIAGAGCESTTETIQLCEHFSKIGVDAVLVHTPCFYKGRMTDLALEHHYRKVADKSPVPVVLYSVPANTGIDLSGDLMVKLSQHSNIIGAKDSAGDITKIATVVDRTANQNFQVLAGSAGFLVPALNAGCVGGVCAVANILGAELVKLVKLIKNQQWDAARKLQAKLVAPNAAVTRKFGVPGLKHMMDLFGYYGGPVRSPMVQLTENEVKSVEKDFIDADYRWN